MTPLEPAASGSAAAIACIPLGAPEAWRAALEGVPHGFTHTWEHCHAMHLTSGAPTHLWQLDCAGARVVCPFVERRCMEALDVATPPGISGFAGTAELPSLAQHWRRFARERGHVAGYIGLNPLFARPSYAEGAETYNSIYTLDLRLDLPLLLARMDANRRRQLRDFAAVRERMVTDRARVSAFVMREYPSFVARVRPAAEHLWSTDTLQFLCGLEATLLIGLEGTDGIEAAHLYGHTRYAADLVLNVSTPAGRAHTTAQIWFAAEHYRRLGVPVLNLGGGVREDDTIAQAKQRFGCARLPLRALKQVYDAAAYARLCAQAGVDPADRGWFPPYRRPRPPAVP